MVSTRKIIAMFHKVQQARPCLLDLIFSNEAQSINDVAFEQGRFGSSSPGTNKSKVVLVLEYYLQ